MAKKIAVVDLPLHNGKAPYWLLSRMKRLGKAIIDIILTEYGIRELLRRLSDPLWFQALAYVLGYDWDSSGVTTVLTGVLKSILSEDHGILVAGGKGEKSLKTLEEINEISKKFGFSEKETLKLMRISKIVAKVDNSLIQDQHTLYHHTMFISKYGEWIVIQQGMNLKEKTARRYHWLSENVKSFVIEPHTGIIGENKVPYVLNMTSKDSLEAQKTCVDLVNDGVDQIKRDFYKLLVFKKKNMTLDMFLKDRKNKSLVFSPEVKVFVKFVPEKINWEALKLAYEISPRNFEELIEIQGIGPATIRALGLIAQLIYRAELSWEDPLRFTFAHGGKDGIPYPVNIKRMEKTAEFLENVLHELKLGSREKESILKRLSKIFDWKWK